MATAKHSSTSTTTRTTRAPKGETTVNQSVEACNSLFGEHPEDVITTINSASEALCWLEEIFKTISRDALDERNGYRIKHLAEAGAYLAFDFANFTDCQHKAMADRLRAAGVIPAEGDAT